MILLNICQGLVTGFFQVSYIVGIANGEKFLLQFRWISSWPNFDIRIVVPTAPTRLLAGPELFPREGDQKIILMKMRGGREIFHYTANCIRSLFILIENHGSSN